MVWQALAPTIKGMESMRRKGTGHDPLMMWLVESLVNPGVMKTPVNPVDTEISEDQEERELQYVVEWERSLIQAVVQFGVTTNLECEEWDHQSGGKRHRGQCLVYLHSDLIFEEAWVREGRLVEHEDIAETGEYYVDDETKDPAMGLATSL